MSLGRWGGEGEGGRRGDTREDGSTDLTVVGEGGADVPDLPDVLVQPGVLELVFVGSGVDGRDITLFLLLLGGVRKRGNKKEREVLCLERKKEEKRKPPSSRRQTRHRAYQT